MSRAGANVLEIAAVSVRRGDRLLFDNVSLTLTCGDIVHVRGLNGSGKTTLLRIVAGLTDAESGEVRWHGTPIHETRQAYGAALNWCGHKDGLKSDLTVAENLRFAQQLAGIDAPAAIRAAAARLGIDHLLDLPTGVLSAGQRRRAALARLPLSEAEVWLLDEPFTNLDTEGGGIVRNLITAHADAGGVAMIAAHNDLGFTHERLRETRVLAPL